MKDDIDQLSHESLLNIVEVTKRLLGPSDLFQMLQEVLSAGKQATAADSGSLWLYNNDESTLEMRFPAAEPLIIVAAGAGLVGECLAKKEVINVPDAYADNRFNSAVDSETGYRTSSILSVPLVGFGGSLVGVMQLLNKVSGPFTKDDEAVARALAAQGAIALQRIQMTETQIAKERLDEEVGIARDIQIATLPDEMPQVAGYDFGAGFLPAEYTGGDLFDLVTVDDEVFILMGDATGHGLGPALSATQMQGMFRVALPRFR